MFPRPDFFAGSKLNFAKNLLFPKLAANFPPIRDEDIAIIDANEASSHEMTWGELRIEVRKCANALRPYIQIGDRVGGFLGNNAMTAVAMLAATSLGAIWTAVSPDTGVAAVLDRLVQIEPKVLFADNGVRYNGRVHESMTKVQEITKALVTLQAVVVFDSVSGVECAISEEHLPGSCKAFKYRDFATNPEFKPYVVIDSETIIANQRPDLKYTPKNSSPCQQVILSIFFTLPERLENQNALCILPLVRSFNIKKSICYIAMSSLEIDFSSTRPQPG